MFLENSFCIFVLRIFFSTCPCCFTYKKLEAIRQLSFFIIRHGKIYLKAAKSYMGKGSDYAKNEILRLDRMLEKVAFFQSKQTLKVLLMHEIMIIMVKFSSVT